MNKIDRGRKHTGRSPLGIVKPRPVPQRQPTLRGHSAPLAGQRSCIASSTVAAGSNSRNPVRHSSGAVGLAVTHHP